MPEFDAEKFDKAASEAKEEWEKLIDSMNPEQRTAVGVVITWWQKWYMSAGHKRLGRVIIGKFN